MPGGSFVSLVSLHLYAWHGSLGGRVHLSPFVSLHLSPFVSLVPVCLPAWMPGTASWVDGVICGVFRRLACVFEAQERVFERTPYHVLDILSWPQLIRM